MAEGGDGFHVVSGGGKGAAELGEDCGSVGAEGVRFAEFGKGFGGFAFVEQNGAEV